VSSVLTILKIDPERILLISTTRRIGCFRIYTYDDNPFLVFEYKDLDKDVEIQSVQQIWDLFEGKKRVIVYRDDQSEIDEEKMKEGLNFLGGDKQQSLVITIEDPRILTEQCFVKLINDVINNQYVFPSLITIKQIKTTIAGEVYPKITFNKPLTGDLKWRCSNLLPEDHSAS